MNKHRKTLRIFSFCLSLFGLLMIAIIPAYGDGTLFFAEIFSPGSSDGYIHSVDTDGSGLQTVIDVGGGLRGMTLDISAGKIYWTDVNADLISRADLYGGGVENLITTGLAWPMGIAVFPDEDLLSWGDQTMSQIGAAGLDGSNPAPLVSTPFHSGIAFDTINDKIYWTTSITSAEGEILRANLDGSDVETVVTGSNKPAQIALDIHGGKVYWTDYVVDVVRRSNLDGTDIENLYWVGANLNPGAITLDLFAGMIYWGQSHATNQHHIKRMELNGDNPEDVLTGDFGIITAIALIPVVCDVADNGNETLELTGNWPNPFVDQTRIDLNLSEEQPVELTVHSIDGRCVANLVRTTLSAGRHEILWDGRDDLGLHAPNGVYFYRIETDGMSQSKRMILAR